MNQGHEAWEPESQEGSCRGGEGGVKPSQGLVLTELGWQGLVKSNHLTPLEEET